MSLSQIFNLRDSIRIIPSKHRYSVSFLPLYCMFYITYISLFIHSLILILRHLILTTFYDSSRVFVPSTFTSFSLILTTFPQLTFLFLLHPFKILYNFQNNHNRVMYKSYNFDLASPSIDHSINFSDSLCSPKGISIEVLLNICVSTFLRVIHLNIYTISTIRDIL